MRVNMKGTRCAPRIDYSTMSGCQGNFLHGTRADAPEFVCVCPQSMWGVTISTTNRTSSLWRLSDVARCAAYISARTRRKYNGITGDDDHNGDNGDECNAGSYLITFYFFCSHCSAYGTFRGTQANGGACTAAKRYTTYARVLCTHECHILNTTHIVYTMCIIYVHTYIFGADAVGGCDSFESCSLLWKLRFQYTFGALRRSCLCGAATAFVAGRSAFRFMFGVCPHVEWGVVFA